MKTFLEACADKFARGAKEHRQVWTDLDPIPEIRGELCDLYNYSTLLKDKELAWDIQLWAEGVWNRLK